MKHVDKATVLKLLREAVAEKGEDYIYEPPNTSDKCVYVSDGEPSCLIARVLAKLGVSTEALAALDSAGYGGGGTIIESAILRALIPDLEFTAEARAALTAAQEVQDTFHTWGAAIRAAERAS